MNKLHQRDATLIANMLVDNSKKLNSPNKYYINTEENLDIMMNEEILKVKKIEKYDKEKIEVVEEATTSFFN